VTIHVLNQRNLGGEIIRQEPAERPVMTKTNEIVVITAPLEHTGKLNLTRNFEFQKS